MCLKTNNMSSNLAGNAYRMNRTVFYAIFLLYLFLHHQEKQDKAALLAEMANLRENNQRLQEESQTASKQLLKFNKLFTNVSPGSDHEAHAVTHGRGSQRE